MSFIVSGLLLVALFFVCSLRGLKPAFIFAGALIPFGSAAVLLLGGLSILALQMCLGLLVAVYFLTWLFALERGIKLRVETVVAVIAALAFYAVIISFFLPRIFEGEVLVFSLDRDVIGTRVNSLFSSSLSPLKPSKGNISQPFYFTLTAAVFVTAISMGRKYSTELLHKAVLAAAVANICLGALDIAGADAFIKLFQTANYAYLTDAKILGRERISGGFPEASGFAGISVALFAYFFARFLQSGKLSDAAISGTNLILGAMSFSSTFTVAAVLTLLFALISGGVKIVATQRVSKMQLGISGFALAGVAALLLLSLVTPLGEELIKVLDNLIFSKSTSTSGQERGLWALRGIHILFETYGLGVGLGSTRTNGLISIWASNFGIFGIILFVFFYYNVLFALGRRIKRKQEITYFKSAQLGLVALLAKSLVSGTTADPGILHMILAAICVTSAPAQFIVFGQGRQELLSPKLKELSNSVNGTNI